MLFCGFHHDNCMLRGFVLLLWIRLFVLLWIRPHNFLFARIRPLVMVSPFFLLWIRPNHFLFERIRPLVMDSPIFFVVDLSTFTYLFCLSFKGAFALTNCLTGLPCLTLNCY